MMLRHYVRSKRPDLFFADKQSFIKVNTLKTIRFGCREDRSSILLGH
jgi:hypothetical protein